MGNAFQDQLLKAGLINDQKVKQAKKEQYQAQKQGKPQAAVDENKLAAQRAKAEQVDRDRELNRKRQEALRRKEVQAQIRQLIEGNRLRRDGADIPYHFTDQTMIKRIYVTESQRGQLSSGALAVVKLGEGYELIPEVVAEKIRQRDEACVISLGTPSDFKDDADDFYADFKVPDDLIW
jgi:uncharacterized protein